MKASIYWLHRKGNGSLTPIYRRPFSIRETLLAPGDPEERFQRCCTQARGFIEKTSIGDLLAVTFDQRLNRQAVAAVVYYDRPRPAGTSRIEVLYPLGREPRQQPLVPGPSG